MWHTYYMRTPKESATEIQQWFQNQTANLWPAALGSLSLRRSPCIREHCEACLRGEKHPSHFLYVRMKGRRLAIYIPDDLVPDVQRSLDNGRELQELLCQTAVRYAKALKHERTAKSQKVKK
jgi:hypothetical protein